jgi:hypothetical protein
MANRDLVPDDVGALYGAFESLNLAEASAATLGESGLSLQVVPTGPFDLELEVDESLPLGYSFRLEQDAVMAVWSRFQAAGNFHCVNQVSFTCSKIAARKAVVHVRETHRVELRLGRYPDRITCILGHMKKAANQVAGDVPAAMYEEWRAKPPPQSDDFDRACELVKERIEQYPTLSAVVLYRPISSGMRRFEFIQNPKAKHPFVKGFLFARP